MQRQIDKIIVHCSDTWTLDALAERWYKKPYAEITEKEQKRVYESCDIGLEHINQWHKDTGFSESPDSKLYCGYHAIVLFDGTLQLARLEHEVGIHCKEANAHSLGICVIGGRPADSFSKVQMDTLYAQLILWMSRYGLEAKQVFGHREFNAFKTCPSISNLEKFRDELEFRYKTKGDI